MSKEIEELLKNRPEVRGQMQQATKELDTRTMPTHNIEGNPNPRAQDTPNPNASQRVTSPGESAVFKHDHQAMPNAHDQQPAAPQGNSKEVDQMLSDQNKAQTIDTGKELNQQHQVSHNQEQDHER